MWSEIDGLGIVPAKHIVYIEAPAGVHELICFQISFNIQGNIYSEIIRDPELVSRIVIDVSNVINVVQGGWIGNRTTRHVNQIGSYRKSPVEFIISHHI